MRHALCWLIALGCMMEGSGKAAEQTGHAIARIIISDRETAAERHAANELIASIAMMTGQSLPVITESEARFLPRSVGPE